jgi:hypothetical protein
MRSTEGGVSVARIWPSNQEVSAKGSWPSNLGVSAKGFGRAIKKSRRKDLAEQPRSLSYKEVGRATKKSRRQGIWPSNQEVSAARNLAEQ